VSTPHDALFKYVFSTPESAVAELRAVLPSDLSARLEWSALRPVPASFVDEHLSARHADLLFAVPYEGREAFLYVLLEHQSSNDPLMAFRLLRYVVRIWESFLAAHPDARALPAVLPVVVHHGDAKWTAVTEFSELLDLAPDARLVLADYLPRFRFLLDDLTAEDEHTLRARSLTAPATAALLLFRYARHATDLLAGLDRWSDVLARVIASPNGHEAFAALLRYTLQVGEVPAEALHRLILRLGPGAEEVYVTTAQQLTELARQEALARGRAEGKAEGKAELLLRQLGLRFGPLPRSVADRIHAASSLSLDSWAERVITAQSLDDVLR
jgi:predicted transposase/invertase (TIGR01784 family)